MDTHPVPLQAAIADEQGRITRIWANWFMSTNVQFADHESPKETDGEGYVFSLEHAPQPSTSLTLYLNGVLQKQNVDYKVSGNTITFEQKVDDTKDWLVAFYRY